MSVTRHVGKCGDILFTLLFDLLFRHANEIYLIHLLLSRDRSHSVWYSISLPYPTNPRYRDKDQRFFESPVLVELVIFSCCTVSTNFVDI